mmetsp:Transcript_18763/g.26597  ORF Transcript_18763/g.26597 Transcript_18763/m.26597 type:complete len:91 (-) Transcript_18763:402-674(-)
MNSMELATDFYWQNSSCRQTGRSQLLQFSFWSLENEMLWFLPTALPPVGIDAKQPYALRVCVSKLSTRLAKEWGGDDDTSENRPWGARRP